MKIIFPILFVLAIGCQDPSHEKENAQSDVSHMATKNTSEIDSVSDKCQVLDSCNYAIVHADSLELSVLILPTSNGYDFASSGYDFLPLISSSLNMHQGISVLPFPYRKLMNTAYYGIYDKRYCGGIIDRVKADYLLMSKFSESHPDATFRDSVKWGYEIKILNVKTMQQMTSIGKKDLKDYSEIERHISLNVNKLIRDMENLK